MAPLISCWRKFRHRGVITVTRGGRVVHNSIMRSCMRSLTRCILLKRGGDGMWIIPLLIIGTIVVAAARKSPREIVHLSRQLPPRVAGIPGPISVLGEILRIGQVPSSTVVLCAIAEAE